MPKKFYLETSVIRSRLIGHPCISKPLTEKLNNKVKITSKFVKMEFERSLICDLIEFYFVLSRSKKISYAIKFWTEDIRARKLKNINYSIADIFIGGVADEDIDLGLLKLRNQIKNLSICFDSLIDRYEKDNAKCHLGNLQLDFAAHRTIEDTERALARLLDHYRKNFVKKCNIVSLLVESKDLIDKIIAYGSKKENFKKQQKQLDNILKKERKLSCFTCNVIGDSIVALECPDYAILLTLDTVFGDLCKVLGLQYEIISSVRGRMSFRGMIERITGKKQAN